MKLYITLITTLLLLFASPVAIYSQEDATDCQLLRTYLNTVIVQNLYYEIYLNNFSDLIFHNTARIGILSVTDVEQLEISASYSRTIYNYGFWNGRCNTFRSGTNNKTGIDDWIQYIHTKFDNSNSDSNLEFNTYLELYVINKTFKAYLNYICDLSYRQCLEDGNSMEELIYMLDEFWGLGIETNLEGTVEVHYTQNGGMFYWELFYNGVSCFTEQVQYEGAVGDFVMHETGDGVISFHKAT